MRRFSGKYLIKRLMTFIFHPSALFLFKNFKGTVLYPSVRIKGASMMKIINSDITKGCTLKCFKTTCKDDIYLFIENSYFGDRCYISSGGELYINHAIFAPEVFVGSYKHDFNRSTEKHIDSNYRIIIEDSAFIGQKTSVVGNLIIGEKSIIGAGSVVTKDVPSYSIAVGNPAKVIKKWNFDTNAWERIK